MEPIAIIGMSAIFPQADNLQDYWDNILNEVNAITEVPSSRWAIEDYYDPDPKARDKSYCKHGGFISDLDFDPFEFGLPPNILEATDISQLLSLVTAKACLEDGGYGDSSDVSRENVGVILGMVGVGSKLMTPLMARLQYPVWDKVLKSYGISDDDREAIIEKIKLAYPEWEENSFPGAIGNVVAGRIANRFNLSGTNCVIDAACASSLAAIRMAVGELVAGHADMMISGGVDTDNSIGAFMCFSKTPAFSKGDKVRTFDIESDGMMVGEGIGMILLKRLADAERDGDRVYAVIKGVGSSSDGRYKSIYAPRPDGQSLALKRAYAEAGFSPSTVGLIEAHGTGTVAGDPAEVEGLISVFSQDNEQKQTIALGSVKSQIGHTKAAAGVAGLIKAALALHNKILPPTINVKQPNPKLGIEDSPFFISAEVQPWIHPINHPRRAGVSSFGFGGTNFHVVLEENEDEHTSQYRTHSTGKVILISADNPDSLVDLCEKWLNKISLSPAQNVFSELADQSESAHIPEDHARIGFVALDSSEAETKLKAAVDLIRLKGSEDSAEHPSGIFYRIKGLDPKGKIVALFPGQGSQYVNMGTQIAMNFPELRQAFAEIDSLFNKDGLTPLSKTVYPIPAFDQEHRDEQQFRLTATKSAQPAIGTFSMGLYRILNKAGLEPDFFAGHSFGELTALWAAGVLEDDDFLALAKGRGEAMSPLTDLDFDSGTMAAVKGDVEKLKAEIAEFPEVSIANLNSKNQVVLAGPTPAIDQAQKALTEKGYKVIPLDVSAAFHTDLVAHAQKPFAMAVNQVTFNPPKTPVFSNTLGEQYPSDPDSIKKILGDHILNPVLFKDEIESIYSAGGSVFIEIGPKSIMTNLVSNILEGRPHVTIALNPNSNKNSDTQLREAVVKLRVLGIALEKFDPYTLPAADLTDKKQSPISVKLNGGLYLSEETVSAFQKAINTQNTLNYGQASPSSNGSKPVVKLPNLTPAQSTKPDLEQHDESFPFDMSGFQAIQQDTTRIQNKFLENQSEYARIFSDLTQKELGLLNGNSTAKDLEQINVALQTVDNSIAQFHQHQADTLRLHELYLKNQAALFDNITNTAPSRQAFSDPGLVDKVQNSRALMEKFESVQEDENVLAEPQHPDGSSPPNKANDQSPALDLEVNSVVADLTMDIKILSTKLVEIVSEKTGYPTEMLDLQMDMEADLGIDSIKRVEILGAMQTNFPDLPQADPGVLSEMRTLAEITEYMLDAKVTLGDISQTGLSAAQKLGTDNSNEAAQAEGKPIVISSSEIQASLIEIVSEKTGYPPEMLEMEMDMEADLGIDSIKRVEILGAMQERFPGLPQIAAGALEEMRTLAEIVECMPLPVENVSLPDGDHDTGRGTELSEVLAGNQAPNHDLMGLNLEEMTQSLLAIVSEKTGYPAEMLELKMDFEADLGIDSIKRVEILGAMQEKYPQLPAIDTSVLAELRTLQQIVDTLSRPSPTALILDVPEKLAESEEDMPKRGVISLIPLPLPDRLITKSPESYLSLVVDEGTLLTVELVEKLLDLDNKVVVLTMPEDLVSKNTALSDSVDRVLLEHVSEKSIASTMEKIEKSFGPVNVFIHLNPISNGSKPFSVVEETILKAVFLTAKHLEGSLTEAGKDSHAAFMTITRMDGQFGLSQDGDVEPISGGFFGLTKSLNLEWEDVFCRAIDLDPELDPVSASEYIVAELFDPNQLVSEVAYNKNGRFTLTVKDLES